MPTSPINGCSRVNMSTSTSSSEPATNICSPLSCTQPMTSGASGRRLVADHRGLRGQRHRGAQPRLVVVAQFEQRSRRRPPCRPASCAAGCRRTDRPGRPSCRGRRRAPRRCGRRAAHRATARSRTCVALTWCTCRACGSLPVSSTTAGVAALPRDHLLAASRAPRPTPAPRALSASASSSLAGLAAEPHHARRQPDDQRGQIRRAPCRSARRCTRRSRRSCRRRGRAAYPSA